jgi:hypothetical protein
MSNIPAISEEAMRVPSGLHPTASTGALCPASEQTIAPVAGFQILIVLSQLPETSRVPSGLQATE